MIKTGTMEKTGRELEAEHYLVSRISATLEPRLHFNLVFTVHHLRGYREYAKVKKHDRKKVRFSRHSQSLLDSMFAKW